MVQGAPLGINLILLRSRDFYYLEQVFFSNVILYEKVITGNPRKYLRATRSRVGEGNYSDRLCILSRREEEVCAALK